MENERTYTVNKQNNNVSNDYSQVGFEHANLEQADSSQISLLNVALISFSILFSTTILAGTICTNIHTVNADTDVTDDVSITVSSVCNLTSNVGTEHTANITPGLAFTENIGLTNVMASCNDSAGYSIYAVGYSGTPSTIGNTNLIDSTNNTTIATHDYSASYTSDSYWSMKLTAGTGADAATIITTPTDYSTYVAVPDAYDKVATKLSATTGTGLAAFTTTYGAYATTTQTAGTYTGKVKYTLVHPNNAPEPFEPTPVVTNPGYISYNPNAPASITPDSMGDQAITATATSAELWASNFQRSGYGFAGWTDKYDWVLNENDADGNGTGANAGYHIYGPNQTISFTAGQYSGDNPGLSLYAVWVPNNGDLQGWTGCSNLTTGQVTALTDTRDNQTYAVAKLNDNKCWMIENLRLDNQYTTGATNIAKAQGYNSSFIGLADPEVDNFADSTTANSLYSIDGSTSASAITGSYQGTRFPRYNNQNTSNPAANMTAWNNNSNTYSVGNWYTWPAAIADTSYYTSGDHNTTSICPTGWHIPTGNTSGEYYTLNTEQNAGATDTSVGLRAYPANFIYSGIFYGSSANSRGGGGDYWSSTKRSNNNSYFLNFTSSNVSPGTNYNKGMGQSIRCSL